MSNINIQPVRLPLLVHNINEKTYKALATEKRNPYMTKWYVLFDTTEMRYLFDGQIDKVIYPCYVCREMFKHRTSFLDHVNRRGLQLKYFCPYCNNTLMFYNTCSFLLHCRDHFSEYCRDIDLDNVDISTIPMDIAGFDRRNDFYYLYEDSDELIDLSIVVNSKFYIPNEKCMGQRFINFLPVSIAHFTPNAGPSPPFVLRQVNTSIPLCIFQQIPIEDEPTNTVTEPHHPVRKKITAITKRNTLTKCSECDGEYFSIKDHFQAVMKPMLDNFKCKICSLILRTDCSLKAHVRYHDQIPPFVCPECGIIYDSFSKLEAHVERICFHMVKAVRFKCPSKGCHRIFSKLVNFSSHFPLAHLVMNYVCQGCLKYFQLKENFEKHTEKSNTCFIDNHKIVNCCNVCNKIVHDFKAHVLSHVNDVNNRCYVFLCRYCHNYYRTSFNFKIHLSRCAKLILNTKVKEQIQKNGTNETKCKVIKFCMFCSHKYEYYCTLSLAEKVPDFCKTCSRPFLNTTVEECINDYPYTSNLFVMKQNSDYLCKLCDEKFDYNNKEYNFNYSNHKCKYKFPVVALTFLDTFNYNSENLSSNRKRKRSLLNNENRFGHYQCKLCNFTCDIRKVFHEHVQQHRDVSTSYQCMECGECFVVKPSLLKHLQMYHLIQDIASYLDQNECYDKDAVRELKQNMRLVPGETKEPVAENQCRICRKLFTDANELRKHFRVHDVLSFINNFGSKE